jgi:pyrroloquinoline-quinone synthase
MDAERITRALERALEGRRLLDHPFYQRWSAGALSREGLSAYAAQYRHFEASLPEWLRTIAATATEPELREQALRNLEDEAGALPTHVDLFERFAAALGAPRTGPTPAMAALLKTYRDATVRGAADGFAAVLAYEAQAPVPRPRRRDSGCATPCPSRRSRSGTSTPPSTWTTRNGRSRPWLAQRPTTSR